MIIIGLGMIVLVMPNCKKAVKPNILLVTIDTLRRDRLGCYGYTMDTTPFLDGLAKEGLMYKNVITPVPYTDPSHASILTSLHPLTHQVLANSRALSNNFETIAEVLKENGYYTIGAVGAGLLAGKYNFNQGFDSFSDRWDPTIKDWEGTVKYFNGKWQRVAKSVNQSLENQVNQYLEKSKEKPLFIWVHYYDPHFPYIDREEIVLKQKKKQWIAYDKEVRYTDNYIKMLYEFLEKKGLTERMVTCITADHGEQLGEHGYGMEHTDFYTETIMVPLIFQGFNIPKNKVVEDYISTMDIGVTLLGLAKLEFKTKVEGVPLFDRRGNLKKLPDRNFLVMGNLMNVRSIQLITLPYSFILNADFIHRYWYFSREDKVPGNLFKPVPGPWIKTQYSSDSKSYEIRIEFPFAYTFQKGLNFAGLRFDIKKNNGIQIGYKLNEVRWSEPFAIDNKKTGPVTAYFPAALVDEITPFIDIQEGTEISGLRYVFLGEEEFSAQAGTMERIKNKRIFSFIKSLRKQKTADELYDIKADVPMVKDLLKGKKYPANMIVAGKKEIYRYLDYYLEKMKKIIRKKPGKPLSKEEKDMLKSLGYL